MSSRAGEQQSRRVAPPLRRPARAAAYQDRHVGWRFLAALVATLLAVALIRTQVIDVVRVSSDSMAPTLCAGGSALVSKIRSGSSVQVDDIVTFASPTDGTETIKRVVAVAGQSVAIEDAQLVVDAQVVNEPYVDHATIDGVYFGPVRVPAGSVFLMCDHREVSIDSRVFGPVPLADLDGRLSLPLLHSCGS
jgi:signal peptidase I